MKLTRLHLFVVLIFTTALTLSGCSIDDVVDSDNTSLFENTGTSQHTEHRKHTQLTLGVFGVYELNHNIREIAALFNAGSSTHYVEVVDYLDIAQGNWSNAQNLLTIDIIAGRTPDMFYLLNLPYQMYIDRGLLVNLNPFIDSDLELSREDLMENVLSALEINGSLYFLPPVFRISSIAGSEQILGNYPGWTFDEFMDVMSENPQADVPLGPFFHSSEFMWHLTQSLIGEFVDYASATVNFDTGDFARLLELGYRYTNNNYWDADIILRRELIASGRHIMDAAGIFGFHDVQLIHDGFGDDIIFKGWPDSDRNGNRFSVSSGFSITNNAECKDAAWSFIRTIAMEDIQARFTISRFPINRNVFERSMATAMRTPLMEGMNALSQEASDSLMLLISSITHTTAGSGTGMSLQRIVSETVDDFFNGLISADDAARIIQSRASIYMSERNSFAN
ncbi:MAG: ABC transporter substrate-binding protein [Oscillospiraceae bacterium]|nr:ABC transporter substrate-binding protein [Oscillospiraceae bacterium]